MREHRSESYRKVSTCKNFRKFTITIYNHSLPMIYSGAQQKLKDY
jgi:hypothetical protein